MSRRIRVVWKVEVVATTESSLWFQSCCLWSLQNPGPLQSFCYAFSSGVSLNLSGSYSHLRLLPAARPGCPVPPVVESWHSRDCLFHPFNVRSRKDGATRELIRGLGILVYPTPPDVSLSYTNLHHFEDFLGSVRSRCDLVSVWIDGSYHRLERIRDEKNSRTYTGEKPPSLFVLTHRLSLATFKPTRHLLAMPWILVRIRALYEGRWPTQFHLPRNYDTIFNPKIFNIHK